MKKHNLNQPDSIPVHPTATRSALAKEQERINAEKDKAAQAHEEQFARLDKEQGATKGGC